MLSPEEIQKFRDIVLKYIPDFKRIGFPLGHSMSTQHYPGGCVDLVSGQKYSSIQQESVVYLPGTKRICSCCGTLGVDEKDNLSTAELWGLGSLDGYSELQVALFALWLNDNPKVYHTAIVVASTSRRQEFTACEEVLQRVGFEPISRAQNPNHDRSGVDSRGSGQSLPYNSYITLWVFKCLPDVPYSAAQTFVEPVKEVSRAVRKPIKRTPRDC